MEYTLYERILDKARSILDGISTKLYIDDSDQQGYKITNIMTKHGCARSRHDIQKEDNKLHSYMIELNRYKILLTDELNTIDNPSILERCSRTAISWLISNEPHMNREDKRRDIKSKVNEIETIIRKIETLAPVYASILSEMTEEKHKKKLKAKYRNKLSQSK